MPVTFFTGFEAGTFGAKLGHSSLYRQGLGTPTVVPNPVTRPNTPGVYSCRCNPVNTQQSYEVTAAQIGTTTGFGRVVRFYWYAATLPTSPQSIWEGVVSGGTNSKLYVSASGFDLRWGNAGTTMLAENAGGIIQPQTGRWYRFDIRYRTDVNPRVANMSIDGEPVRSSHTGTVDFTEQLSSTPTTTLAHIMLGSADTATYDFYYDDLAIASDFSDYPLGASGGCGVYTPSGAYIDANAGSEYSAFNGSTTTALTQTFAAGPRDLALSVVDDPPPLTNASADYILQTAAAATSRFEVAFAAPAAAPQRVRVYAAVGASATTANSVTVGSRYPRSGTEQVYYTGTVGTTTNPVIIGGNVAGPAGGWTAADVSNTLLTWGGATDVNPVPHLHAGFMEYELAAATAVPFAAFGVPL